MFHPITDIRSVCLGLDGVGLKEKLPCQSQLLGFRLPRHSWSGHIQQPLQLAQKEWLSSQRTYFHRYRLK